LAAVVLFVGVLTVSFVTTPLPSALASPVETVKPATLGKSDQRRPSPHARAKAAPGARSKASEGGARTAHAAPQGKARAHTVPRGKAGAASTPKAGAPLPTTPAPLPRPGAETGHELGGDAVGWDWGIGEGLGHGFLQSFAFDEVGRYLYTLQHSYKPPGTPAIIRRWTMDGPPSMAGREVDHMAGSLVLGHQTLFLERTKHNKVKVWAAAIPERALRICRFDYVPNGEPGNIEYYNVFDSVADGKATITANLSYDSKWLIIRGRRAGTTTSVVKVFDFKSFVAAGPGDRSGEAKYVWEYQPVVQEGKVTSLQGLASDGTYIYLVFSDSAINKPNLIRKYTLDGRLVSETPELMVGKLEAARIGAGHHNEMEGGTFVRLSPGGPPRLVVGMILGGGPTLVKRLYILGAGSLPK
jgi:hypothetical protein